MEDIKASFDPKAGRRMKPRDAARWTKQYRKAFQQSGNQLTRAHYFGKDFLQELLAEPGCAGLRIYQAIDDAGMGRVVLVSVDEEGKDLLPRKDDDTLLDNGDGVGETLMSCPEQCDPNSTLMQ